MLTSHMGETVTLEQADGTVTEVTNVLAKLASESDQTVMDVQTRFINQARYKGDQHTLTLIWPTSAPHDLLGAHVTIRGERYRVYGKPWPLAYSPTAYDMRVTVTRSLFLFDLTLVKYEREQDAWGTWQDERRTEVATTANLLRLSETFDAIAGQSDLTMLTLFELSPDTWDDGYTEFVFQGDTYRIYGVDKAGECVVISGTKEVVT